MLGAVALALVLVWWECWPEDDPATQDVCLESHNESIPGTQVVNIVCDKSCIEQCVRWRKARTWAGKTYKACELYE